MTDQCVSNGINFLSNRVRVLDEKIDVISADPCCEVDNQTIDGLGTSTMPLSLAIGQFPPNPQKTGFLRHTLIAADPFHPSNLNDFEIEIPASSSGYGSIIGINHSYSSGNVIAGTISGGDSNSIQSGSDYSIIGGGISNTIGASSTTNVISGGTGNFIQNSSFSAINGGKGNGITGSSNVVISGGENNLISNSNYGFATGSSCIVDHNGIAMGSNSSAFSDAYAVGIQCGASGQGSFCAGDQCLSQGLSSCALGKEAQAIHTNSFVWNDSNGPLSSVVDNSVTMRASGGYRLFSDAAATTGVSLASGAGAWASISDKKMKENTVKVNEKYILEKLIKVPVYHYNYVTQKPNIRHIGVFAQDFYQEFSCGEEDTKIYVTDEVGVCIAAIQELYQEYKKCKEEIIALKEKYCS